MIRIALLPVFLACSITAAYAEQFAAKVIVVIDGDTVVVSREGSPPVKVRLADIDAPENTQEGGAASKESLSELVLRRQVSVSSRAVDNYGRLVAHLAMDGKSVNEEQVRRGMAWGYSLRHRNQFYVSLQLEAQQARRGLWSQNTPIPPWDWRKQHPSGNPVHPSKGAP